MLIALNINLVATCHFRNKFFEMKPISALDFMKINVSY